MALKTSGAISFSEIAAEFGGAAPYSLSAYYRGGARVPASAGTVPASGAISFSQFYGAANKTVVSKAITANVSNLTIAPSSIPGYVAGMSIVQISIGAGVVVSASSTGSYALQIAAFASGDEVTLINNGTIVGMGGAGGAGISTVGSPPFPGLAGGPALKVNSAISITNNGTIAGGGNGGAGGTAAKASTKSATTHGGGGGGGRSGLTNSAGGEGTVVSKSGSPGTFSAPGVGGAGANSSTVSTVLARAGVTGGAWGGGACVAGSGNVTWVNKGALYGALA